jgi:hypothetical protein
MRAESPLFQMRGEGVATVPYSVVRYGEELGVVQAPLLRAGDPAPGFVLPGDVLQLEGFPTLVVRPDMTVG